MIDQLRLLIGAEEEPCKPKGRYIYRPGHTANLHVRPSSVL